jgi:hypothetical protein
MLWGGVVHENHGYVLLIRLSLWKLKATKCAYPYPCGAITTTSMKECGFNELWLLYFGWT